MSLILKLGTLFVKQVSKPVANGVRSYLRNHSTLGAVASGGAQRVHRLNVKVNELLKPAAEQRDHKAFAGRLSEEKALEAASTLISEMVVFSISAAALVLEVHRGRKKEAEKESVREEHLRQIIRTEVESVHRRIDELERARGQGQELPSLLPHWVRNSLWPSRG